MPIDVPEQTDLDKLLADYLVTQDVFIDGLAKRHGLTIAQTKEALDRIKADARRVQLALFELTHYKILEEILGTMRSAKKAGDMRTYRQLVRAYDRMAKHMQKSYTSAQKESKDEPVESIDSLLRKVAASRHLNSAKE